MTRFVLEGFGDIDTEGDEFHIFLVSPVCQFRPDGSFSYDRVIEEAAIEYALKGELHNESQWDQRRIMTAFGLAKRGHTAGKPSHYRYFTATIDVLTPEEADGEPFRPVYEIISRSDNFRSNCA